MTRRQLKEIGHTLDLRATIAGDNLSERLAYRRWVLGIEIRAVTTHTELNIGDWRVFDRTALEPVPLKRTPPTTLRGKNIVIVQPRQSVV